MGQKEPPSSLAASLYMIGKDSRGRWVVQDQQGLHGGLFVNRAQALKFALFENGNCPQAVIMVPGTLELTIGGSSRAAPRNINSNIPQRRAA
jgi:hypothetical protein